MIHKSTHLTLSIEPYVKALGEIATILLSKFSLEVDFGQKRQLEAF